MSGSGRSRGGRALLLAAALTLLPFCHGKDAGPPARPPAQVTVEPAQVRSVPVEQAAIGTVTPISTIAVRAHVGGTLDRVFFQEGQEIRKGDVLFQIDPRPYRAALEQARANVARDEAQLRNARVEEERYRRLLPRGIVARSDYDARVAQARALEAAVAADRAAIQSAAVNLDYTRIESPIDGRTGALQVTAGNLVKADDTTPLVVLRQLRPIDVAFSIPGPSLPEVRQRAAAQGDLKVLATVAGRPRPEEGRLFFIDNAVDTTTGTVLLKARFANEDTGLWPGQYVDVRLVLQTLPDAVVIAARAVQPSQEGQHVFVVKDGKEELRRVETGPRYGDWIVVREGVAPGEEVVVDGMLGVVPGAPVQARAAQQVQPGGAPPNATGNATASDGHGQPKPQASPQAQGRRP